MTGRPARFPIACAAWLLLALPATALVQGDESAAVEASHRSSPALARVLDGRMAKIEAEGDISICVAVETLDGLPVYRWSADRLAVLRSYSS